MSDGLADFNQLPADEAERHVYATFASRPWAQRVVSGRPYSNFAALLAACESGWAELKPADWLAAFAAHPRIGGSGGHAPDSSEREQRAVRVASSETLAALAEENRRYEERFGHVFLISASGRSAEDILTALRARIQNDPATEVEAAAGEHRKITWLRLERMLNVMTISTHVLDTARGRPAAGVSVTLCDRKPGGSWTAIAHVVTGADGRVEVASGPVQGGEYRLEFGAADYFKSTGTDGFYPEVTVVFTVRDGETRVHVPLLLSPFGYSTYKGQ